MLNSLINLREKKSKAMLLPNRNYTVDYSWTGSDRVESGLLGDRYDRYARSSDASSGFQGEIVFAVEDDVQVHYPGLTGYPGTI